MNTHKHNSFLLEQAGDAPSAGGDAPPAVASYRDTMLDGEGKFTPGWHEKLPDDLKAYAPSLQTFSSVNDVFKSYGELKKAYGQKVQPPNETSTPEQVAKWRQLVGAPESLDGYKFEKPSDLPAGMEWNEGLLKSVSEWALSNHIPPKSIEGLISVYNKEQSARLGAAQEKATADGLQALQEEESRLKTAWGDKFDANSQQAKAAAAALGIKADHYALFDADIMQALHRAAPLLKESKLIQGDNASLVATGKTQAQLIQTDKSHAHYAAYHNPNHPQHEAVRSMVLQLMTQQ